MARTKYPITLTAKERKALEVFVSSGEKKARQITRARILLYADVGKKDVEIQSLLEHIPRWFTISHNHNAQTKPEYREAVSNVVHQSELSRMHQTFSLWQIAKRS